MAFVSRAHCLVVVLASSAAVPLGCSTGDNDDASTADGPSSPVTTVASGETGPATDPTTTTDAPTTTPDGTTTADPSTTSTTTDAPTTTDATTDSGGSDETGPICEPGAPNCVCDEGACAEGYVCIMGVCGDGLVCPGDVEPPNESEENAVELGNITDDDDDFLAQAGVLAGATDVDWFHLHGADTFGHVSEPTLTILGGMQRSCVFLQCDEGGVALTTITCPKGTDVAITPQLRPGCCGTASFSITDFGCPGQDDSLEMWIRLDKPASDVCSEYDFQFHF